MIETQIPAMTPAVREVEKPLRPILRKAKLLRTTKPNRTKNNKPPTINCHLVRKPTPALHQAVNLHRIPAVINSKVYGDQQ
jgi:hypothetical protein